MKKFKIIMAIILGLLLIGGIILLYEPVTYYLNNIEEFKSVLKSQGPLAGLIIFLVQILQVIIAFIPSDGINIMSGYILGTWGGFFVSYLGIMVGSIMAFYISRFFGRPLVEKFVKKETLAKIEEKVNSNFTTGGIFIMCFIPFMPRDIIVYAMGLTPIKAKKFFIIYALARLPLILLMSFTGSAMSGQKNIAIIGVAMFLIYILLSWGFKKKKAY